MGTTKILHTCDSCRARKVRCIKAHPTDEYCINCKNRGDRCHFSRFKKRESQSHRTALQEYRTSQPQSQASTTDHYQFSRHSTQLEKDVTSGPLSTSLENRRPSTLQNLGQDSNTQSSPPGQTASRSNESHPLYIDSIISNAELRETDWSNHITIKAGNHHVPSNTMSFFSELRLVSLIQVLGHTQLRDVVNEIENSVHQRGSLPGSWLVSDTARREQSLPEVSEDMQKLYIEAFFEQIGTFYPILSRQNFERKAYSPNLRDALLSDPTWCALYHAVLTLGCLCVDGRSFEPGKGPEWEFMRVAINKLTDVLVLQRTLQGVQALVIMAIYGQCYGGLPLEELLITEAARAAITAGLHRSTSKDTNVHFQATFWAIYCLEKEHAFNVTRSSVIEDFDVACPIPCIPDANFNGMDWLRVSAAFARILSKSYKRLFSISAMSKPETVYQKDIDDIFDELTHWKNSIPDCFRPGSPIQPQRLRKSILTEMAVRIHLNYYNLLIALSRLSLHVCPGNATERQRKCKATLLQAARSIIDVSQLVVVAPFVSALFLGHIPITAIFVLFDFVIHNPVHPETKRNMAFLEMAAGHFLRLGMATAGHARPVICELVHIARQHVQKAEAGAAAMQTPQRETRDPPEAANSVSRGHAIMNHQNMTGTESGLEESASVHGDSRHPGANTGFSSRHCGGSVQPLQDVDTYMLTDANHLTQASATSQDAFFWAEDLASLIYPLDGSFFHTPEVRFFNSETIEDPGLSWS